jgi:hypothetical protein
VVDVASSVGPTRRIISFVAAVCLTMAGGGSLAYLLLLAPAFYRFMAAGAGLMFAAGLMWLYSDLTDAMRNEDG